MKIGDVRLRNNVLLAPMAGITTSPFRRLCVKYGAGHCTTEMISPYELGHNKGIIKFSDDELPLSFQLFGSEPKKMAEAARFLEKHGASIIDINLGCPAHKIIRQKAGSYLLGNPKLVSSIVKEVVKAVDIPVTAKIRLGLSSNNYPKTVPLLEEAGVSAIIVHARTQKQGYSGKADWNAIKEIKQTVSVPVIGNGDIIDGQSAKKMSSSTHCDAVMVGRAAIGNPFIFRKITRFLDDGTIVKEMSPFDQLSEFLEYCPDMKASELRKVSMLFIKRVHNAARLRDSLSKARTRDDVLGLLEAWNTNP